ncbi:hypothetical protein C4K46_00175 [Streptococcus oricebi]|uniref:Uncharacterized protein n=1 Tax=Streptococcus oricebi TaxID=1547447 RepID=A0ABS5B315_9STRE|nr:hypothetical protein [Streptococcus oricebi]
MNKQVFFREIPKPAFNECGQLVGRILTSFRETCESIKYDSRCPRSPPKIWARTIATWSICKRQKILILGLNLNNHPHFYIPKTSIFTNGMSALVLVLKLSPIYLVW